MPTIQGARNSEGRAVLPGVQPDLPPARGLRTDGRGVISPLEWSSRASPQSPATPGQSGVPGLVAGQSRSLTSAMNWSAASFGVSWPKATPSFARPSMPDMPGTPG